MTALTAQDEGAPIDVTIGENIHNLLWSRRIQQQVLAAELHLTPSVLSRKLRGSSGWSAAQVDVAARFLEVEPGRLFRLPSQPKVGPNLTLISGEGHTSQPTIPMLTTVPISD